MKVAILALVLWGLTLGAAAYFFLYGTTRGSADRRRAVVLTADEKGMVLAEMRHILEAVHGVLTGVSAGDLPEVARSARSAGMQMEASGPPELLAKLPLDFKTLGLGLHRDFDKLADDVQAGLPKEEVITRLSGITSKCVACHATYRIATGRGDG